MKIASTLFLFVVVGCTWRKALCTCVFQSDFGFVLNCAFKKSGLFRVRNLGGVKGYVGLGELNYRSDRDQSIVNFKIINYYSLMQLPLPSDEMAASVNEMTLLSLQPIAAAETSQLLPLQQNEKQQSLPDSLPSLAPIQGMETSLKALAEASNITLEALEAAILLRQQQLLKKQQGPMTTSTTTTTMAPLKNKHNSGATKVMNAPREYYPVGYDKNFDDNFASRVDLPDTSFYCGDQKHFPGLYADEDLGCMVFHVCALTDDGLIMKSFLCPESTLFDQTILKCNWWFYVDCKASKSLYDSNIPISKSYQLMKALAFFSAYKNHENGTNTEQNSKDNS
ncbi:uncharacterized protein LOC115246256 [Formica exsecta]|uniref:uncharacterized protein LOC115246256 n=1 Tax=Formica exsecta TaxID=72781 RepID=UPI00114293A4|nr:uncharacterized protein LOC115246256 [Formica exsecta]